MTDLKSQYFNNLTGLNDDKCELCYKDVMNNKLSKYSIPCYNKNIGNRKSYFKSLSEPGIYLDDDDGWNTNINNESFLKNGKIGNKLSGPPKKGYTLCREPLYSKEIINADILSRVYRGEKPIKSNKLITEQSYDRFIPLVPSLKKEIQSTEHIIPKYWTRGGIDTRAEIRNTNYIEACGYTTQ